MSSLWFWIVAAMIAIYAVFEGSDLGAGVIYLLAAKTNDERRRVMRAVGPAWDGNELWLIAAALAVCFAFPRLYDAVLDGFHLPLMIVICLLILHALAVGIRARMESPSLRGLCDVVFSVSSILLIALFGIGLGNVIRGVPLDSTGHFFQPLWTDFKLGPQTGLLDWYTTLTGVMALVTLAAHGSYYVALKTDVDLGRRARGFALLCWPLQFFLTFSTLIATYFIRPEIMANYEKHPIGILVPIILVASLAVMLVANPKGKEKLAFAASSLYIAVMLGGISFALYPVVLPARDEPNSLTIYNASMHNGFNLGLGAWIVGVLLALIYFVFAVRKLQGKVPEAL